MVAWGGGRDNSGIQADGRPPGWLKSGLRRIVVVDLCAAPTAAPRTTQATAFQAAAQIPTAAADAVSTLSKCYITTLYL